MINTYCADMKKIDTVDRTNERNFMDDNEWMVMKNDE
jgi:hypothetical protein